MNREYNEKSEFGRYVFINYYHLGGQKFLRYLQARICENIEMKKINIGR